MIFSSNRWVSGVAVIAIGGFIVYQQIQTGHPKAAMITIGVVAAIIIPMATYYILRAMKGNLKLELAQKSVVSGDSIGGRLHLNSKKPIHADRLYIALIGERRERSSSSGSGSNTRWVEFYRDEVDVLLNQDLPAGFAQSMDFEINTPDETQVMNSGQLAQKAIEQMEEGTAKTIAQSVGGLASVMGGGRKRWRVISRLETKGVDLAASQELHVSLKQQ